MLPKKLFNEINLQIKPFIDSNVIFTITSIILCSSISLTVTLCLKKGSDQIVALLVQHKMIRGKFPRIVELQSQKMQNIKKLTDYLNEKLNIYEFYMEDTILSCSSISVDEKYRGKGIGAQMLEAQKVFMRRMNLKVASKYIIP